MAQEGASLTAAAGPGASPAFTNPFANASMVVSGSVSAANGGVVAVPVALEVSHDGTSWARAGLCWFGMAMGNSVNAPGFPGVQLRANILNWPAGVTGTISATVCGV